MQVKVTPLLMPGSTGLRRSTLFDARSLNDPHWGDVYGIEYARNSEGYSVS